MVGQLARGFTAPPGAGGAHANVLAVAFWCGERQSPRVSRACVTRLGQSWRRSSRWNQAVDVVGGLVRNFLDVMSCVQR